MAKKESLTQTTRYLSPGMQPPNHPYLTTKGHFHSDPKAKDYRVYSTLERSFYRGRPAGSYRPISKAAALQDSNILASQDTQDIKARTKPSSIYAGTGKFVVELPHSTITYPNQRLSTNSARAGWRSEYMAKYINKTGTFCGYSAMSKR